MVPYKGHSTVPFTGLSTALVVYKVRSMVPYKNHSSALVVYKDRSMVPYKDLSAAVDEDDDLFAVGVGGEAPTNPEVIDLTEDINLRRSTRRRTPTNRYDATLQANAESVDELIFKRIGQFYHATQGGKTGWFLFFGTVMEFIEAEGKYLVEFNDKSQVLFDEDEIRHLVKMYNAKGWEHEDTHWS
jgi:hypothetical protein